MNPERQRITIAIARGWLGKEAKQGFKTVKVDLDGFVYEQISEKLPDYLYDLNAMHDVIMGCSLEEQCEITEILRRDVLKFKAPTITASAAQLAEAFLRQRNFSIETLA